jgi:hypothetical protein
MGEARRTKKGRGKRKKRRREGRMKKEDPGRPPRGTDTVRREREREAEKKTRGSLHAGRDPRPPSLVLTFSSVRMIKSSKG